MAPAPAPKVPRSKGGAVARLTAKVGPLPVWGWAAVILGAYLLYSRMRPPAATTSSIDSTAAPDSTGDSASQVPASGMGSPADNLSGGLLDSLGANTSSIDALTYQLLNASALPASMGDAPAAGSVVTPNIPAPAAQPSRPPATTVQAGAPPAQHPSQTAAGVLKWGGLSFTTKAAFDSWARGHGSSTTAELNNHPSAKAIYSTLK